MSTKKSRAFVLVYNNPLDTWEDYICNDVSYTHLIFQYEMGHNGTPHFQGYIRFTNAISITKLRTDMPGCHVEIACGGPASNVHYCSKPVLNCTCNHCVDAAGTIRLAGPFEYGIEAGKWPPKPVVNKTREIIEYAKGHTVLECIEMYPAALRLQGAIRSYQQSRIPPRTKPPVVIILWGDSGAGKTRYVYDNHATVYKLKAPKNGADPWFDNYVQQDAMLLDDWPLAEDQYLTIYHLLLDLLDRYQYTGAMKGVYGGCQVHSPFIYLTSNDHPLSFFKGAGLMALQRRVTAIAHCIKGQEILLKKNI